MEVVKETEESLQGRGHAVTDGGQCQGRKVTSSRRGRQGTVPYDETIPR